MLKTLLVADDAAIIRTKIKQAACSVGWTVVAEAGNGKEAVDHYAQYRPTAVTVDLVMPGYDGIYAMREIFALDPDAQVIVVSAISHKSLLKDAFRLGAIDFVVKPFDQNALLRALEQTRVLRGTDCSVTGIGNPGKEQLMGRLNESKDWPNSLATLASWFASINSTWPRPFPSASIAFPRCK